MLHGTGEILMTEMLASALLPPSLSQGSKTAATALFCGSSGVKKRGCCLCLKCQENFLALAIYAQYVESSGS